VNADPTKVKEISDRCESSAFNFLPSLLFTALETLNFIAFVATMKHLAAYLLLHLQNPHPTKQDVEDLLETVDIKADAEKLSSLFSALEGKDVMEVYSSTC
jgi:hypothetical protein